MSSASSTDVQKDQRSRDLVGAGLRLQFADQTDECPLMRHRDAFQKNRIDDNNNTVDIESIHAPHGRKDIQHQN